MEFSKEEADACYASMTALIEETARASLPTDTREHTTDERLQRRFDGFSRLLCLKPGFSICSSVAIVEGELIIGLSTTGMLSSEEMTFWVLKKLSVIREFINQIRQDPSSFKFEKQVSQAICQLMTTGGTTLPIIFQQKSERQYP